MKIHEDPWRSDIGFENQWKLKESEIGWKIDWRVWKNLSVSNLPELKDTESLFEKCVLMSHNESQQILRFESFEIDA